MPLTGRGVRGNCAATGRVDRTTRQPELEFAVVKAEWGSKRICPSCGARYYDLMKPLGEIVCPKCGTQYDPEAFLKTRRARVAAVPEKEIEPIVAEEAEVEAVEEVEAIEEEPVAAAEGDEEEEEELIEDASELGEDEDDMAEVIENIEEDDER